MEVRNYLSLPEAFEPLHGPEYNPVREVAEKGDGKVVDKARHAGFFAGEHPPQGLGSQFFGRKAHPKAHGYTAEPGSQAVQSGIHGSRGYNGYAYPKGLHLVPDGFGETVDVGLGGNVGLDAGKFHPLAQRGHVKDEPVAPLAHIGPEKAAKPGRRHHMQHHHALYLLRRRAVQGVEEEEAGIVDEDVYREALAGRKIIDFPGSLRPGKVAEEGAGLDAIGQADFPGRFFQLLLLVGNHQEVTGIIPRQNRCILEADSAACPCHQCRHTPILFALSASAASISLRRVQGMSATQ